jgi:hypothetical protein
MLSVIDHLPRPGAHAEARRPGDDVSRPTTTASVPWAASRATIASCPPTVEDGEVVCTTQPQGTTPSAATVTLRVADRD